MRLGSVISEGGEVSSAMILGSVISYDTTPMLKLLIIMYFFIHPSYDLKAGKKCTVRARLRAGGERLSKGLATPRLRTDCVVFACRSPAKGPAP